MLTVNTMKEFILKLSPGRELLLLSWNGLKDQLQEKSYFNSALESIWWSRMYTHTELIFNSQRVYSKGQNLLCTQSQTVICGGGVVHSRFLGSLLVCRSLGPFIFVLWSHSLMLLNDPILKYLKHIRKEFLQSHIFCKRRHHLWSHPSVFGQVFCLSLNCNFGPAAS